MTLDSKYYTGATVRLTSNARLVTEGVGQEAAVCLVLEDIHDRLQREIHFNLSVVALFLACKFYIHTFHIPAYPYILKLLYLRI